MFTRKLVPCFLIVCWLVSPSIAEMRRLSCEGGEMLSAEASSNLVTQAQESYEKVAGLSSDFEQLSYLAAIDMEEESHGRVYFRKPGKMRWEYAAPEKQLFIIDKRDFWLYQPRENQVLIDTLNEVLLSDMPVAFLMGLGSLTENFQPTGACRVDTGIILNLIQREGVRGDLKGFTLLLDSETRLPRGAETRDVGGNITTITFKNFSSTLAFDRSDNELFVPQFPDGVDIQDRRGGSI